MKPGRWTKRMRQQGLLGDKQTKDSKIQDGYD